MTRKGVDDCRRLQLQLNVGALLLIFACIVGIIGWVT